MQNRMTAAVVPFEQQQHLIDDSNRFAIDHTAAIVAAFVSRQTISPTDLPKLIAETYRAVYGLYVPAEPAETEVLVPAVPIRKSVTDDYIICLDDGQKFKSLKRHLSSLGMTPDQYRAKWGLPKDFPMTAANYSARRSALAKAIGLGTKGVSR